MRGGPPSARRSCLLTLALAVVGLAAQTPPPAAPPAAPAGAARRGSRARPGAPGRFTRPRRPGDDRRDRPRQPGAVRRRPQEGRVRGPRGRRAADPRLVHAGPRRTRLQRRGAAAAGAAGRHHPAAVAAGRRRRRPHPAVRGRRSAPRLPQHRPAARAVQEDPDDAAARRRHVGHGLDRAVVDRHRRQLRHEAVRRGDEEDHRQRPQAERDHRGAAVVAGAERSPLPGPRRVLDRLRPGARRWRRSTTAARR